MMDYKLMIEALNLKDHTETLLRIKDHILPEVWEQLERYLETEVAHETIQG